MVGLRQRLSAAHIAVALAVVTLAVRAYLAYRYFGFQTGDDVEIAEQAFRTALGLEFSPWNVRSLFIPDLLVAPLLRLASLARVTDPILLAWIARWPFVVLASVNIWLVFVLGRRWYGESTGLLAAALYSAHWIPMAYGSSLYPRIVAVTCVLAAVLLLDRAPTGARGFVAGLVLALAVTTRYSEAIFLGSVCLAVASRDRRRSLLGIAAGFAVGLVLFVGAYDRWSWGRWFGSLIEFAHLTFIRRDAASVTVAQPPWWYVANLHHWLPLTAAPLVIVAAWRGERRRAVAFVLLPLLVLSAIFHKELRYLQVVIPFALLLAARGFTLLSAQPARRRLALALIVLAFPLAAARIGTVRKRSTNAAAAALWMRSWKPEVVATSQPWAYGGRLFLGNEPRMWDLDIPPDPDRVRDTAPTVDAIAVYVADVTPGLAAMAEAGGLTEAKTFEGRGGRAVAVFFRPRD